MSSAEIVTNCFPLGENWHEERDMQIMQVRMMHLRMMQVRMMQVENKMRMVQVENKIFRDRP